MLKEHKRNQHQKKSRVYSDKTFNNFQSFNLCDFKAKTVRLMENHVYSVHHPIILQTCNICVHSVHVNKHLKNHMNLYSLMGDENDKPCEICT